MPFRVGRDSGAPLIDIPLPAPLPAPARPPGDVPEGRAASPVLPVPAAECAADARPAAAEPADQAATATAAAVQIQRCWLAGPCPASTSV